jgi:hypothetical protein
MAGVSSFSRDTTFWLMMLVSMSLVGTTFVLGLGSHDHWSVEVIAVVFAVCAYGLALIACVMAGRSWIRHKRSDQVE